MWFENKSVMVEEDGTFLRGKQKEKTLNIKMLLVTLTFKSRSALFLNPTQGAFCKSLL